MSLKDREGLKFLKPLLLLEFRGRAAALALRPRPDSRNGNASHSDRETARTQIRKQVREHKQGEGPSVPEKLASPVCRCGSQRHFPAPAHALLYFSFFRPPAASDRGPLLPREQLPARSLIASERMPKRAS